jgi:hypothetical protein
MTAEEIIARAKNAEQIINDPLVAETLDALERKWIDAIMQSPVEDAEGRELSYRMYQALRQFRAEFVAMVGDGVVASHNQEMIPRG